MPVEVLTLFKFVLIGLLYLFVFRTAHAVSVEVTAPRRAAAPPRPGVATKTEPPRRSRRIPRQLVIHRESGAADVVALSGAGVILGRGGGSDVLVEDIYISDEHAEVLPDNGSWSVRDLGSTNGTFLNGAKVTRPTPLAAGDQLRLGKTHIEVRR